LALSVRVIILLHLLVKSKLSTLHVVFFAPAQIPNEPASNACSHEEKCTDRLQLFDFAGKKIIPFY
jgi:hypothetical protein